MSGHSSPLDQHVPGGWVLRTIRVAGRAYTLKLPADPDQLLEQLAELPDRDDHRADPYWAALWPAAQPTAEAVLKAQWPEGAAALEIGSGVGLVGLAALTAGLDLSFSDYSPDAVRLALENAGRNGFPTARGLVLDWRRPINERYDVILASDVLYDQQRHAPVLELLHQMLTPSGVCWIGDPGRYHAEQFLQSAAERSYSVQLRDQFGAERTTPTSGSFQLIVLRRSG